MLYDVALMIGVVLGSLLACLVVASLLKVLKVEEGAVCGWGFLVLVGFLCSPFYYEFPKRDAEIVTVSNGDLKIHRFGTFCWEFGSRCIHLPVRQAQISGKGEFHDVFSRTDRQVNYGLTVTVTSPERYVNSSLPKQDVGGGAETVITEAVLKAVKRLLWHDLVPSTITLKPNPQESFTAALNQMVRPLGLAVNVTSFKITKAEEEKGVIFYFGKAPEIPRDGVIGELLREGRGRHADLGLTELRKEANELSPWTILGRGKRIVEDLQASGRHREMAIVRTEINEYAGKAYLRKATKTFKQGRDELEEAKKLGTIPDHKEMLQIVFGAAVQ